MGMKTLLMPIIVVVGGGCSAAPPSDQEYRPFKSWCDAWQHLDSSLQVYILADISKGVPSSASARLEVNGPLEPQVPNWDDLVREILRRSRKEVLIRLLRERLLDSYMHGQLAGILAEEGDPEVFAIVMADSVPEEVEALDWNDPCVGYRHRSTQALGHFLRHAAFRDEATQRLIELLGADCHSWVRASAAAELGDSDDPASLRALLQRLNDEGSGEALNGTPETNAVGCRARWSVQRIQERLHGRSVDP